KKNKKKKKKKKKKFFLHFYFFIFFFFVADIRIKDKKNFFFFFGVEEQEDKSDEGLILSLARENEDMRKKLSDLSTEREREREKQMKREEDYLQALERSKLDQLKVQMEKEQLKKERENVQHERELIEKERKALLLQKQQKQQKKDSLSAFDINSNPQTDGRAHAAHAKNVQSTVVASSNPGRDESIGWLTVEGVLDDHEWTPCVEKKYKWILHNYSSLHKLKYPSFY
ncbi:hypothetical protein RFI_16071, partial [Reticulomyxa filosa]